MNLIDVTKQFATDDQCLDYIEQMRWPDGVKRCPTCGNDKLSRIERKKQSKNKRTRIYQCLEKTCKAQFSPTAGTIFHDSHLPLTKWFMAIALVMNAKKGMSALQLQRDLGIGSYRTAWYLYHRIRESMQEQYPEKLGGIVEMDELYVGGKQRGKGIKYGMKQKQTVFGIRQREGNLRMIHTTDAKADTLKRLIEQHVSPDVRFVMTDASTAAKAALVKLDLQDRHHSVNHIAGEYVRDKIIHTNTIESAFSLFRRGVIGSFHTISIKHLQRYLNEFCYRFDRREIKDAFEQTVRRVAGFAPITYRALISEKA